MNVILASQSPRRRELLGLLNIPFEVRVADIDENLSREYDPRALVLGLSQRKAMAVAAGPDDVVIGADTVVACDGKVLGKPGSPAEAEAMLRMLSGRAHQVYTGVTVLRGSENLSSVAATTVRFRSLTHREIKDYVATGEPMDKAGAYAIQGGAGRFCEELVGDYHNVVGLPVALLKRLLDQIAPELFDPNASLKKEIL